MEEDLCGIEVATYLSFLVNNAQYLKINKVGLLFLQGFTL